MSDMRKLRAFSESSLQETTAKEIRPEPRALMDAEEGNSLDECSICGSRNSSGYPLEDGLPPPNEETEVVPFQDGNQGSRNKYNKI